MYTIEDLSENKPIIVSEYDAGYNILEIAILNAFHEQMPYASLDDIPYVDYNPGTGEVQVDNQYYEIDQSLQNYLTDAHEQLNTIPLPQIKLKPIEIYLTHPEKDDQKGFMKIRAVTEPS